MGGSGNVQLNLQQLALALQNQANANSGAQLGAGVDVFGGAGGLNEALANAPTIYINVRETQLGHPEVSVSIGTARIFLPQQSRVPGEIKRTGGESQAVPTENVPHEEVLPGMQMEMPVEHFSHATAALSYGRELVFSFSHDAASLPQSLIPSRTGDVPGNPSQLTSGASRLPARGGDGAREAGPALRPQVVVSIPTASLERVPQAVRQLLTQLQLLPPGTNSADILPRLQEVVRLWNQEAAKGSNLPADVVRVVNNFLASAVLVSATMVDSKTQQAASTRSELTAGARTDVRDGASLGNPLFASQPMNLTQISGTRIAEAVMNLLSTAQPQIPAARPQPPQSQALGHAPASQSDSVPHQAQRAPSLGLSAAPNGASGVHPESGARSTKTEGMVRLDASGRPMVREDAREQRLIGRTEVRPEVDGHEAPIEVPSQGTYDREASSELAYEGQPNLESLWPSLHQELRQAGFLDSRNGSVRALRSSDEGRTLAHLIASRVPEGFDVIDVLELVGHKIGWSEKSSPVNEAFARLSGYRGISDHTKAGALREPLQDAIVILGMSGDILSSEEMHVLQRFEGHLPIAEMFLEPENEAWFGRLENKKDDSRSTLESELEEARSLYVDHLAKQNGMRNLFNVPETPRLLN